MDTQKRSIAADIIRCLAFFFVVSVHFLLNNGFYSQIVEGERMLAMTLMRALFIICVPLFIMLSGYLLRKKELSKKYYARISKIIITYLLASVVCVLYSVFFLNQEFTLSDVLLKILNFSAAPYSWYIEMYLGLFLLIPFLNILYNNIPSQKRKLCLVITFVILTSLPSVVNVYNFTSASWWALPSSSLETNKLIPAWWVGFYPITYYFIGSYLSEYGLKIKKTLNVLLIILCLLGSGFYSYWRSYKTTFIKGAWCGYESVFNIVLTTLVFVFIINNNYEKIPPKLSRFIQKVSALCLGGYLVSWVFDSMFYPKLTEKVPLVTSRLEYYFVIVPAVFVLSVITSNVLSMIQLVIEKLFKLISNNNNC